MRKMLIVLVAVSLVVLGSCSDDDGDDEAADTTVDTTEETTADTSDETAAPDTTSATIEVAEEFPCDVLDATQTEELFGPSDIPPDATTTNVNEDGVEWTAAACNWTAADDQHNEAILEVTQADGFPSGSVECPAPAIEGSEITGLGDAAYWYWNDPGTELTVGELRVCSADALVDVDVSGSSGEDSLQADAITIAQAALAAI